MVARVGLRGIGSVKQLFGWVHAQWCVTGGILTGMPPRRFVHVLFAWQVVMGG